MAQEVREDGDEAACIVLCGMVASVQQGMYGALPELFRKLSPLYCVRLGDPPPSLEHDCASEQRPGGQCGTAHARPARAPRRPLWPLASRIGRRPWVVPPRALEMRRRMVQRVAHLWHGHGSPRERRRSPRSAATHPGLWLALSRRAPARGPLWWP